MANPQPNVELLLSCMNLQDDRVGETMNVQSDLLILDQCDEDSMGESNFNGHTIRHLKCTERGLSRSRNKAIECAHGDIGLLCDDDEQLVDGYPEIITRAYRQLPDADLICFRIENKPRHLKPKTHRISKWKTLSIGSWQISMDIAAVRAAKVTFDVLMGSGSGNGAGEEAKFLQDCLKAGLVIYYVPENIGRVGEHQLKTAKQGESAWFTGLNEEYFYQKGTTTRYMLGLVPSILYSLCYPPTHKNLISGTLTPLKVTNVMLRGAFENPIGKQARALGNEKDPR